MPLSTSICVRRAALITTLALFSLTGTAWADEGSGEVAPATPVESTTLSRETCADPLIENPFAIFGDLRDYVLAPGGS